MKKKFLAMLMASVMVLGLAACGGGSSDAATEGDAASGDLPTVGVLIYKYDDTYISTVRNSLQAALEGKANVEMQDGKGDQATQNDQLDVMISKGVDVLCVNMVDAKAASGVVEKASAAGIPTIFFNREPDTEVIKSYDKACFIGTNAIDAGKMQGDIIKELWDAHPEYDLNGDGKISYVLFKGQEGNLEAIARTQYAVEDCNAILENAGKPPIEFYDAANANQYLVDQDGNWSSAAATNYMSTILARHSTANNNMVELVIANNDEMALGAVSALQSAGYNKGDGSITIPVFGVDATDAAKAKIADGSMAGTIKQDGEGMAQAIKTILDNFNTASPPLTNIDSSNIVGSWRVNVPYSAYTGE